VSDPSALRLVSLSMIADMDYLALARTSAMHVGALLAFPLPQVGDLRLAVNEACACFLDDAARREPDAFGMMVPEWMELAYDRFPDELHVTVRAAVGEGWPAVDELGWAVLRALVGDLHVDVHGGVGALTLILPLPTGMES
jgi:anti-sigma regulatory factor (Ser/Thr protein kinase)